MKDETITIDELALTNDKYLRTINVPLEVDFDRHMWIVHIPYDATVHEFSGFDEGWQAVMVKDGVVVGGGQVSSVITHDDQGKYRIFGDMHIGVSSGG